MSNARVWVVEWSQEAYDHWMSLDDDAIPITGGEIFTLDTNYTVYIGKGNELKLPPDYNPHRKHWESKRYIPKHKSNA